MTHTREQAPGHVAGEVETRRVTAAFRAIAAALADEQGLESIFRLIVDTLSSLTDADRCSLHLLDRETGLFRGRAGHAADNIDDEVRQLVSGMPGDGFTREILETRRPVMVTDAATDARTVHAAMRRWRARSVLGVPMLVRDEVIGILCLDSEDTAREFSHLDQELAVSFAELAATAINRVELTAELRLSLTTQAQQFEMLQRARRMEGQLADIVLQGWGVRQVAEGIARLLSKPCGIFDSDLRCLTQVGDQGPGDAHRWRGDALREHPDAQSVLAAIEPGRSGHLDVALHVGIRHRYLAAPIDLNGARVGYVVVAETGGRFGTLDEVMVRRAAHNLALEKSRSRLEDDVEWHLVESFTRGLIRGSARDSEALARSLGIDLDERRFVCLVASRDASVDLAATSHALAQHLNDRESPSATLGARLDSEVALLISVPSTTVGADADTWVRNRVEDMLATFGPGGELCAAISGVVAGAEQTQRAYRDAQQVLRCIRVHASDATPGVVSAPELGPARLLLASASRDEARQFAADAFGLLMDRASVKSAELLLTLEAFLRRERSVRLCASDLTVHPNTVRYRLASVERVTQLMVTTDDADYMTAQLAMTVIRLAGLLPVRADSATVD
ncbi:helix-turn-helix domain-containing protein [soil metagenome]